MKLFKLSLLIPSNTSNVEKGFSLLTVLHTKVRNKLGLSSLDKLMRINIVGTASITDEIWGETCRQVQEHV